MGVVGDLTGYDPISLNSYLTLTTRSSCKTPSYVSLMLKLSSLFDSSYKIDFGRIASLKSLSKSSTELIALF